MDETDDNVISVDRFRKHVWWVGGNATGYRPLLQTAAQLSSCQMADVVAEVAVRSISSVSQTTIRDDSGRKELQPTELAGGMVCNVLSGDIPSTERWVTSYTGSDERLSFTD